MSPFLPAKMSKTNKTGVVLLSGGLDSATTLAIARRDGFVCHALSFDYGQRHRFELGAAAKVAKALGAVEHRIVRIDLTAAGGFGHSALTDDIAVPKGGTPKPNDNNGLGGATQSSIPVTYVPARNTIFLSLATSARLRAGPSTSCPQSTKYRSRGLLISRGTLIIWRRSLLTCAELATSQC